MSSFPQSGKKTSTVLFIRPIVHVAVKGEVPMTTRKEMLGDKSSYRCMVHQDSGIAQMRSSKTKVHGWLTCLGHEVRQIIAAAEPRENPVAFPAPRNNFFLRCVWAKMPVVLQRVLGNARMQPVIIPAHRKKDAFAIFLHWTDQTVAGGL